MAERAGALLLLLTLQTGCFVHVDCFGQFPDNPFGKFIVSTMSLMLRSL